MTTPNNQIIEESLEKMKAHIMWRDNGQGTLERRLRELMLEVFDKGVSEAQNLTGKLFNEAVTSAEQAGYARGQEDGARGKFFSSIEMTKPLPKHIYDKIEQASYARAMGEAREKIRKEIAQIPYNGYDYYNDTTLAETNGEGAERMQEIVLEHLSSLTPTERPCGGHDVDLGNGLIATCLSAHPTDNNKECDE